MSGVIVMGGPGLFGSRTILRLLAAAGEARRAEESTGCAVEDPATLVVGDVQRSPGASFIAAGRDQDAEGVDAVAGSEFVDDRIRLQE